MKQHITVGQLNELSREGKEKLRKWWKPKEGDRYLEINNYSRFQQKANTIHSLCGGEYCIKAEEETYREWMYNKNKCKVWRYPLLSVGQIIEFLWEKSEGDLEIETPQGDEYNEWRIIFKGGVFGESGKDGEFCDALWKAVKGKLEK